MNDSAQQQPVINNKSMQVGSNLVVFGEVLDKVSSKNSQQVHQDTSVLNPANPVRSSKERIDVVSTPDVSIVDGGSGVSVIEQEIAPEIPVEVESFLHRVKDNQEQAPKEIVIADGTQETTKANYPSTPVVVLPITQKEEKEGRKKSPKFSFRWLIEWSHKIIKLFAGKIIYREEK